MHQDLDIINFSHCEQIYRKLDHENNASTYTYTSTMSQLILRERNVPVKKHVNDVLRGIWDSLSVDETKFYDNVARPKILFNETIWGIYSVYKYILLTRDKLLFPICAQILTNGKFIVHPGTKRLLIAEHYHHPVTVLVTDYTKQNQTDISELQKFFYNSSPDLNMFIRMYNYESSVKYPSIKKSDDKLVHYELYSHMTGYNDLWKYDFEFTLHKTNNQILFNNEPFLILKNNFIEFDV